MASQLSPKNKTIIELLEVSVGTEKYKLGPMALLKDKTT